MALLYELSDDPAQAILEIRAYCSTAQGEDDPGDPEGRLLAAVREPLVDDDYVDPHVSVRVSEIHRRLEQGDSEFSGPLGLYLCLNKALACALSPEPDPHLFEEARSLFAEAPTRESFRSFYGLSEDYDLQAAELHRVGTTSLILRCPTRARTEIDRP